MRRLLFLLSAAVAIFAAPAAEARVLFEVAPGEYTNMVATVQPRHLPAWVQVAVSSTSLYPADSASSPSGVTLSRFTFLRVLSGGSARLEVDVFDEYGSNSRGLRGWVDVADVLPSAPGTNWLVSSRATGLWRTSDISTDAIRGLDVFTPLQQIDGPIQGRLQVRVYRPDFTVLDEGWVDIADTGPALPPQARVPSPTPALSRAAGVLDQQAFLDATAWAARIAAAQTGVPASVTVAQAILESDWGRSGLAQTANNYFGIKAFGSMGSDGVVWMPTSEYDSTGALYETVSPFRAYASLTDSLTDHDRLLQTSSRYALAMGVANNPRLFAVRLYEAGYSTDPEYADKLISLMDRYDLYRLDG